MPPPTPPRLPALPGFDPEDFFWPGRDTPLKLFEPLDAAPRRVPGGARIDALVAASDLGHRLHLTSILARARRFRSFPDGLIFPTVPIVVEDLALTRSMVAIGGKFLFSGAAGGRLMTRISKNRHRKPVEALEGLAKAITAIAEANPVRQMQATEADRDLDLVLPARNFFNYYHFTRETLPLLTLHAAHRLRGKVVIQARNREVSGFVGRQIERFFPELAPRVELSHGDRRFERAILPFDTTYLYYFARLADQAEVDRVMKPNWLWQRRHFTERNLRTLLMNSIEAPVEALRDRVRAQIAADPGPPGPRRLYVRRRPGHRNRPVIGEELLEPMLADLGFETVHFEDHDVLDQARLMAGAEAVVMSHGAGLTNMLWVDPGTLVVELSHLQMGLARFGIFHDIAMVAGARHLHAFVDHDTIDTGPVPNPDMAKGEMLGQRLDAGQVALLRSALIAALDPDGQGQRMDEMRRMNRLRDFAPLEELLNRDADRLLHEPDAAVWAANCAQARGRPGLAYDHLLRALRLAPNRVPLIDRVIRICHRRADEAAFAEAALCYFRADPAKAAALFADKGWDATAYAAAEADDSDQTAGDDEETESED